MKVYYNGDILTMEDDNRQAEILVEDAGRIVYVGDRAGAPALDGAEEVDLQGHTLMPAFIDGHGHFSNTALFTQTCNVLNASTNDELVALLSDYRNAHPDAKAMIATGYDHNFLVEQTHITKAVLDRVSTEMPIVALHTSGHMGVVNSKALEMAGVTKDTPEIPGGVIMRDPETGEPNGVLEETALFNLLTPLVGDAVSMTPEDLFKGILLAQQEYIENGVLTVQEGAAGANDIKLVRGVAATGQLKVDVVSYPCCTMGESAQETVRANKDCLNQYVNHYKIGGYKIVADGSPQCKTAWLTKPYTDGSNGYPWITEEDMQKYVDLAVDEELQLLTHCNGDATGDLFLSCYEKAMARYPEGDAHHSLRPVMIHCQTARADQLDKMADLDMIASIFVAHVNYWGDVHLKNLGPERAAFISPVKAAMDRGIVVNFHTDTPVTPPYMLHSVWTAVNRVTRDGIVLGPDQCVDVWRALKAVTINAAYSYFEEDSKGSLKAGKLADLVILDKNPLAVDKMAIKDIRVLASIKEGQVLYRAK
ncbi:MAG: amidohydrolase [Peptococcaceae bacterium]|nr:amidohydrolase [Peptococcaceae bacterium]